MQRMQANRIRHFFTALFGGARGPGALACVAALAACVPTYNWRQSAVDAELTAMFPCKPDDHRRRVTLAQRVLDMRMLACEAGGANWVLTVADTGDVTQVEPALQALQEALGRNLGGQVTVLGPVVLAGSTPHTGALRARTLGRQRDGAAVQVDAWTFARGTRIYQASVIRPGAPGPAEAAALDDFFSGLAFAAAGK